MERRKLIKLGNSSYAIALPKSWVSKSGLKKGDEIFVIKNSHGELMIMPSKIPTNREAKTTIDIGDKTDIEIEKEINSFYCRGFEIIYVGGIKNKKKKDVIKNSIDKLIGLEIIEDVNEQLVIKNLFKIEDFSMENFIRRIDNNLSENFENFRTALTEGKINKQKIVEIYSIDKDITKFYFLIWRIVNIAFDNPSILTALRTNPNALSLNLWTTYNLEQIGDEIKEISKLFFDNKFSKDEKSKLSQIFIKLEENYHHCLEAFYENNRKKAQEIMLKKGDIMVDCRRLSQKRDEKLSEISEKFKSIANFIHNNSKIVLYGL